jgi:hypothetical protein
VSQICYATPEVTPTLLRGAGVQDPAVAMTPNYLKVDLANRRLPRELIDVEIGGISWRFRAVVRSGVPVTFDELRQHSPPALFKQIARHTGHLDVARFAQLSDARLSLSELIRKNRNDSSGGPGEVHTALADCWGAPQLSDTTRLV